MQYTPQQYLAQAEVAEARQDGLMALAANRAARDAVEAAMLNCNADLFREWFDALMFGDPPHMVRLALIARTWMRPMPESDHRR